MSPAIMIALRNDIVNRHRVMLETGNAVSALKLSHSNVFCYCLDALDPEMPMATEKTDVYYEVCYLAAQHLLDNPAAA